MGCTRGLLLEVHSQLQAQLRDMTKSMITMPVYAGLLRHAYASTYACACFYSVHLRTVQVLSAWLLMRVRTGVVVGTVCGAVGSTMHVCCSPAHVRHPTSPHTPLLCTAHAAHCPAAACDGMVGVIRDMCPMQVENSMRASIILQLTHLCKSCMS